MAILRFILNLPISIYTKLVGLIRYIAALAAINSFNKHSVIKANAIFEVDDKGQKGAPYCNYCWQSEHKKSPLHCLQRELESDGYYLFYQCTRCKEYFRLHFMPDGDIVQWFPSGEPEETK